MHGRWRMYVSVTKEMMKRGEALVGMKRSGNQLYVDRVSEWAWKFGMIFQMVRRLTS